MVTNSVECGIGNHVSPGGCSDESYEDLCEIDTISDSGDSTSGPE